MGATQSEKRRDRDDSWLPQRLSSPAKHLSSSKTSAVTTTRSGWTRTASAIRLHWFSPSGACWKSYRQRCSNLIRASTPLAAPGGRFELGRKTKETTRPAIRKLLVHDNKRRVDKPPGLAYHSRGLEKDPGVDRTAEIRARSGHARILSARSGEGFSRCLSAAGFHFVAGVGEEATMNRQTEQLKTRRKFLRMLSASPLLASPGLLAGSFSSLLAAGEVTEKKFLGWLDSLPQSDEVISSPDQALEVMDFEAAARKALPPAHFGYLATGVDDDATLRANREAYSRIQIRPRRLVDVEEIDMSVKLLDTKWKTPLVLSPVSAQKAFHPEGEVAVARAARAKGHLMMLSTVATSSIEEVTVAAGAPVWQQLYPTNVWEV